MVLYKLYVFCSDMKFKMAATAGPSTLWENVSKRFFSEITRTVETKLPRNDHWKVLYKFYVFYADRKSKMAATAIYRLTLDPMGKCSNAFFSETTWTVETKLPRNDHWKVLYKVSVFYADRKSKMAATTGHSINTGPYGENTEIYSSLKLLH